MAQFKYPLTIIADGSHTAYLYRCQELLRNLHNVFVDWRDAGLTEMEWADNIPYQLRQLPQYAYVPKADPSTVTRFIKEEFEPRVEMIQEEILKYRKLHKETTRWNIEVFNISKFERI